MSTFRVLQFNMQFGQGWDDAHPDDAPIDLEVTIAELRRHEADIIFLQEVERAGPGGTQPEPPTNYLRLRTELEGYDSVFRYPRPDVRELPFGIGLAIFSRTTLREPLEVTLPSPPVEFVFQGRGTTPTDRLLIGAKTTVAGREIQLFNTHLLAYFMLGARETDHLGQRTRVAECLASVRGPAILAGDFNVSGHESLLAEFAACGFASVQQTEITWRRRPYVLDHIFYNAPLRPVSRAVVPTAASDHHLVVAEFEWVK